MEEDRLMQSMLLDFYGELLSEKQRECFSLHCNEDMSLSEIAQQSGISRQGVWDNIRRAEAALRDYEEKTGLVRRFVETKAALAEIRRIVSGLSPEGEAREALKRIDELAGSL